MVEIKRVARLTDVFLHIEPPITKKELQDRIVDYPILTPARMTLKSNHQLYRPTKFKWKSQSEQVQLNHCANPFCKNFGLPQKRFCLKNKPYRYRLIGKVIPKPLVVIQTGKTQMTYLH